MDDITIEKYVNLTATPEEIEAVHKYLLEDMERCFLILQKMRERAMNDLNLSSDPIIEKILSTHKGEVYSHRTLLQKSLFVTDRKLKQEVDMRKVLSSLFQG